MNIDVDTHFTPIEMLEHFPSNLSDIRLEMIGAGSWRMHYSKINGSRIISKANYDVETRTQAMKEACFDKACLMQTNGIYCEPYSSPRTCKVLARLWNDSTARLMERDDHFIGIAQVSHLDVNDAMEEAERAVKDLGFRAIEIHGRWGNESVASPVWWPLFELTERLGVPLWFHSLGIAAHKVPNPWQPAERELSKMPPALGALFGFLLHPQVVCASLTFSGIFDKYPGLRFAMTESEAGWVPGFMEFLDFEYTTYLTYKQGGMLSLWDFDQPVKDLRLRKRPSDYIMENFKFTLASTNDYAIDTLLPILVNQLHFEKNLMIETDYDHPEGSLDIVRRVMTSKISQEAKEKICGKNAAELLGMEWTPSAYSIGQELFGS